MKRFIYNSGRKVFVYNGEFKEEDHPRGEDGKFGGGGGGKREEEKEGSTTKKTDISTGADGLSVISGKSYVSVGYNDDEFHFEQDPETGEEYEVYDDYYKLDHVYVEPSKRGKGLAKEMIKKSLSNILAKDPKARITLSALPEGDKPIDQEGLVSLYKSLGFVPTKEQGSEAVVMEYKRPRENTAPRRFIYKANP